MANFFRIAAGLLQRRRRPAQAPDASAAGVLLEAAFRLHQDGRVAEALPLYEQAIDLDPRSDAAHNLLGIALCSQARYVEGEASFRRGVAINPSNVEALNNLASALKDRGDLAAAETYYQRALDLRPGFAAAWNNLGLVNLARSRRDDAERCFRLALRADSGSADAHNNLGATLRVRGLLAEAEMHFRAAISANPAMLPAWCGLADVLSLRGALDEAEACCRRALEIKPDDADAINNLATIANTRRAPDVAEKYCSALLREHPHHVGALNNLGNAAVVRADYRTAEGIYRHALDIEPDSAVSRFNLSTTLLMLGDYSQGFALYESRFDAFPRAATPWAAVNEKLRQQPPWRGDSLRGRRLLVWAEQGLGDSIMMLRYLPKLRERGVESVTVLCHSGLQRLVDAMSASDAVVAQERSQAIPDFDEHCPMMSLPLAFGTRVETIPDRVPYIAVREAMIAAWRERMATSAPKIGIVWAGDKTLRDDARRSIPLDHFAPLLGVDGVRFVSLQKGDAAMEWSAARGDGGQFIDRCDDFLDTAALIANLDLVVSVDTAVAHLAGALGRPVWLLNRFGSEWRWGLEGERCRWYPSMRIFREPAPNQWKLVMDEIVRRFGAERHNLCLKPISTV